MCFFEYVHETWLWKSVFICINQCFIKFWHKRSFYEIGSIRPRPRRRRLKGSLLRGLVRISAILSLEDTWELLGRKDNGGRIIGILA